MEPAVLEADLAHGRRELLGQGHEHLLDQRAADDVRLENAAQRPVEDAAVGVPLDLLQDGPQVGMDRERAAAAALELPDLCPVERTAFAVSSVSLMTLAWKSMSVKRRLASSEIRMPVQLSAVSTSPSQPSSGTARQHWRIACTSSSRQQYVSVPVGLLSARWIRQVSGRI